MDMFQARTLLGPLLRGAPGERHILTLTLTTTRSSSTYIQRCRGGPLVEHPEVVEFLCGALAEGTSGGLVLRTFTDRTSHTLPNGLAIPLKYVCGWTVRDHGLHPLKESEIFAATCTDASTGEPLPPERGVEYTGSWPVDLTRFRALRAGGGER